MTDTDTPDTIGSGALPVLHAARIKGVAPAEALTAFTGLDQLEVDNIVARLVEAGLLQQRQGRVSGYFLTEEGRAAHLSLLESEQIEGDLTGLYDRFMRENGTLKQACTRWQGSTRAAMPGSPLSGEEVTQALDWLRPLHQHVAEAVAATAPSSRFARYPGRLEGAVDRVQAGEREAVLRPMSDSFHDVWMELHQDLLLTLGRERSAADGS